MDDLSERLRRLGKAVAEVSDRAADRDGAAAPRARQGFVSGTASRQKDPITLPAEGSAPASSRAFRSRWWALAAAACVALAGAGWRLATPAGATKATVESPVSFSVGRGVPGAPRAPGVVGEWVAAGPDGPSDARFSDGSALRLSSGARMRVTTTNPSGAEVLIERGAVHVVVAHGSSSGSVRPAKWAVRAGPFEVRVTGTTFDAAWDPMAETFELTMIEGRVQVTGPNIPPERTVSGGERLVVSARDGRMVLSSIPPLSSPGGAPASSESAVSSPGGAPAPSGSAAASRTAAPSGSAGPSTIPVAGPAPALSAWRELAAKGRYRDAFAAAEVAGFSQELERAPAGDLLMLADAARFSGSPGRAREALLAARRRFGARGQSAFLLGKIAADRQGSPGDAVGWFETYLREEPGGPLAEQALGRIVDLTRRSNSDAAKQAAARYLARYPDGSYAALARSLTQSLP